MNNLEWLCEHDRDAMNDALRCFLDGDTSLTCDDCAYDKYRVDGKCQNCSEWLMAPHANDDLPPKNDVSDTEVDVTTEKRSKTEHDGADSRDKLEEDIVETISFWGAVFPDARVRTVLRWLDRQAAITERHWMEIVGASANANVELKRQIDVLTDQLESAHAKNRALKAHISKMQEGRHGWHVKGKELQEKVDSLTQANGDLRDEWHRVCRERDELQRKLHESNRERESLRKQLGIAIDHAHDMIALVSVDNDEGAE